MKQILSHIRNGLLRILGKVAPARPTTSELIAYGAAREAAAERQRTRDCELHVGVPLVRTGPGKYICPECLYLQVLSLEQQKPKKKTPQLRPFLRHAEQINFFVDNQTVVLNPAKKEEE